MWDSMYSVFEFIWGIPLTIFIIVVGVYFTKNIGFLQLKFKTVWGNTVKKVKENNSYRTIMSVLGGTVGSGNIAGIATAVAVGGPGAIFWMWVVALFSMATKMVEVTLAVRYQKKDEKGNNYGGPMYYIKQILGTPGKVLAAIYSVALLVYVICDSGFVQINTIATSIIDTFHVEAIIIGIVLLILAIIIFAGGLKRIGKIMEKTVPFMCMFYILASLIVIFANIGNLPAAFRDIFVYAFKPAPILGGFAGATIVQAISKGAARGIFANEAGLGTSTTVHATTTNNPVEQGMWGILEVSIVSFVVCTITALLVMSTGAWTQGLEGAPIVLFAFETLFGKIGKYVLCIAISTFAFSSYVGFFFEFTTCIRYLFKEKYLKYLKWIYVLPILPAVVLSAGFIWDLADMAVGFIIVPNLIALLILAPKFKAMFKDFKEGKVVKSVINEEADAKKEKEEKAPAKKAEKKATKKVDLSKKTLAELKEMAKEKGIKGYTSMNKAELLKKLK